jgi:hypothetical protein
MLAVWLTLLVLMCTRSAIWPKRNSVYPTFADAGRCWREAADLYDDHFWKLQLEQFRYTPIVAVSFVPLSLLPDAIGGVVWRLVNILIFFSGVVAYCRVIYPGRERLGPFGAACIGGLLIALSLASLNNGQANAIVIGSLLLAVVAAERGRWNWAALALAVPIFYKIYPVAVALLMLLAYPRQLGWRLAVATALGLLLPFALQDTGYVAAQYRQLFARLSLDDRTELPLTDTYRDAWLLVRWAHVPLAHRAYVVVQLLTAAGAAALVVVARLRAWPQRELLHWLLTFGCGWIILFGPATENCTYILIAPTFAVAAWEAYALRRPVWTRGALAAIVCIFVGGAVITALPDGRNWAYPLNPLAALLLVSERLLSLAAGRLTEREAGGVPTAPARAA